MKAEKRRIIEEKAVSLLLKQKLKGEYALALFDYRRILTGGTVTVSSISSYEKMTGSVLPFRPEGMTVKLDNKCFILYDEKVSNRARINWTVCHELGHICLEHEDDSPKNQREANLFASSLLIPEAVLRFLDCRNGELLPAEMMTNYFGASLTACKKRRDEIGPTSDHYITENEKALIEALFGD